MDGKTSDLIWIDVNEQKRSLLTRKYTIRTKSHCRKTGTRDEVVSLMQQQL